MRGSWACVLLTRTVAFGVYDHGLVCALETVSGEGNAATSAGVLRERLWKIRARAVIAATGAFERPLLFADNDRPGVMLAGAAAKYAAAYGVACGARAVLFAHSDSAYAVAAALARAGIVIRALIEGREQFVSPLAARGAGAARQYQRGARQRAACAAAQ